MKATTRFAIALAACALPAMPAFAQSNCELHVWPAERMNSLTQGLLGGGLLDAALHAGRDASNRSQMASALDSPSQLDALQSLNLVQEIGLPAGTTVIRHETPLERHTMNSIKTRRSESTASCYYELITADVRIDALDLARLPKAGASHPFG